VGEVAHLCAWTKELLLRATPVSNNWEPNGRRRAVLIVRDDMFANSVKPRVLDTHLRSLGFDVRSVESAALGRRGETGISRWLPALNAMSLALYARDGLQAIGRVLLRSCNCRFTRYLNGMSLLWTMVARGEFLAQALRNDKCDVLICESGLDQAVVLHRVAGQQLLDLPSPFGDELLFANQLSVGSHRWIRSLEESCLSASDRTSFHWHTYEDYVRSNYKARVRWLDCSYGVTPKSVHARFSAEPRVVFLGGLKGAWVNLPLLERLSKHYQVDVWGGPPPAKGLGVRYLGYAPDLDILAKYQIGLVTVSDDPLRRLGFSSKQLQYFSYGLPTLVPAWRSDPVLAAGSVPYTEDTFLERVATLADRSVWEATSAKALELASQLSWESALGPLTELLGS